eukprot:2387883-Prymnesium_polylepis.1
MPASSSEASTCHVADKRLPYPIPSSWVPCRALRPLALRQSRDSDALSAVATALDEEAGDSALQIGSAVWTLVTAIACMRRRRTR